MAKKPKNYVNNADLLKAIVEYQERCKIARENNQPIPQQTDYMGIAFMKIAENFANRYGYRNYTYKDEMIADGIMFCVKSVEGFDAQKFNNPFAFFTTSIYFAFIQKIQKEKKQLYIRYKHFENSGLFDTMADHDETELLESAYSLQSSDTRQEFIREFEESLKKKKDKAKLGKE